MALFDRPTILMCPPDFFGIEYVINPWMDTECPSDNQRAREQWTGLRDILTGLGVEIRKLDPVAGLPDLVFTANAGLVRHGQVYLSNFRHAARQAETPVNKSWFTEHGFATVDLPDLLYFEGAGDALFCGETLFGGYIIRSDASALQQIGKLLDCHVIPLQLVDERYYHLDTCFCPLNLTTAIYFPAAFDSYGQKSLETHVPQLIRVSPEEAARFACNAVVVGKHVVLNTGCPRLAEDLKLAGYTTHETPLDEFLKAGGSAKCLTLRLDGEDAASWKYEAPPAS